MIVQNLAWAALGRMNGNQNSAIMGTRVESKEHIYMMNMGMIPKFQNMLRQSSRKGS